MFEQTWMGLTCTACQKPTRETINGMCPSCLAQARPLYLVDLGGYYGASGLVAIDVQTDIVSASELAKMILDIIGTSNVEKDRLWEKYWQSDFTAVQGKALSKIETLCKEQLGVR